jgi:hypothetical protein
MRHTLHPLRATPLLLLCLTLSLPAGAQPDAGLPRGADPNDWESYFDLGNALFERRPQEAVAAFEWASKLDPSRAEPLLARWATFFAVEPGTWRAYLSEDPQILRRPSVIRNDSLRTRAELRNPFVHRGLEVALYTLMGRELRWGGTAGAFVDYGRGRFDRAAERFGRAARHPERDAYLRFFRALSLVGAGEVDAAVAELEGLLEVLRGIEERRVGYGYHSKATLEHALGLLHEAEGRTDEAREAYGRALVEDLAHFPARQALARLALAGNDAEGAVEHLAAAAEAVPGDGVVRYELGNALYAAGRVEEAAESYREALAREPFYADVYLRLGMAYDRLGERERALAVYRTYLERAPRKHEATAAQVRSRVAALGG